MIKSDNQPSTPQEPRNCQCGHSEDTHTFKGTYTPIGENRDEPMYGGCNDPYCKCEHFREPALPGEPRTSEPRCVCNQVSGDNPECQIHKADSMPSFWRDAINLCHSESNRWAAHDLKTSAHWKDVAALLEGEYLARRVRAAVAPVPVPRPDDPLNPTLPQPLGQQRFVALSQPPLANCVHCGEPIWDNGAVAVHLVLTIYEGRPTVLQTQWCDPRKKTIAEPKLTTATPPPQPAPQQEKS